MSRKREFARIQRGALSAEEAEKLFATVDETGHTNEETARKQRKHRRDRGHGVDIDPLSDADPSGSNVEKVITKTAVAFVAILLVGVVTLQVMTAVARRASTANLAENVNITTVASALKGGVEWGNGFTQFPEEYSVQEADENTHRIEVTVTDISSGNALEAFAGSQIQATAFSVNALLNPNINTVIYHVNVYVDGSGKFQKAKLFGLIQPGGDLKTLMTFVWTKTATEGGVRFNCTISGVDSATAAQLRESITSPFTPSALIGYVFGEDSDSSAVSGTAGTDAKKDGKETASDPLPSPSDKAGEASPAAPGGGN